MGRLQSLIVLLLLLSFHFPIFGGDKSSCSVSLSKLNRLIDSNRFETGRGIDDYIEIFPDSFTAQIAMLSDYHHWIDAGSGEGYALLDFFKKGTIRPEKFIPNIGASWFSKTRIHFDELLLKKAALLIDIKEPSQKPKITGISYHMDPKPNAVSNINFKVGRFFEDIPLEELDKADLITDLFGVMSYSPRLDEVLARYHRLLKPSAKAYIFVGDYLQTPFYSGLFKKQNVGTAGWYSNFGTSRARKKNGEEVPLVDWISSLSGFSAKMEGRMLSQPPAKGVDSGVLVRRTLVLEKNNEPLKIPKLRLVETNEDKPPVRVFEEIEE